MRNNLIFAALLLAVGCAAGRVEKKVMNVSEWKGQEGGSSKNHNHLIVYDADAWSGVWTEVGQAPPAVDFSKSCALFVFAGERPTGGWGIVFEEPVAKGDDLLVRYRITKPTGMATQAFTHPWRARVFPKPKGRLIVEYVPR